MAKKYVPDEGKRQNPKRTKWCGDRQSTRERVQGVKVIQELGKRMDKQNEKLQEIFSKGLEKKKKKPSELKNMITEMKNTLKRINSRKNKAEEWISNLKHRIVEVSAVEQNKNINK